MFRKILIANRGEIACRIIRTARRMGVATVAVYSDADRNAPHVEMADERVGIGPGPAAESYLVIERIVGVARETGAEAVHPGYGFLAENAHFARALEAAGIVFIGPPAAAIEAMGDKLRSKALAAKAGVAIVPGHAQAIADPDEAMKVAKRIGYPVMLKASAGGGGKGMRIACDEVELCDGFARARSEARSAFGDDRLLLEKFIEHPRHIEMQVLADSDGNVIHLGERECSIQRRHQKIVEEAPSSFVDAKMRAAMGAHAVALAKSVDYRSAGTVEFIADAKRNFYFLEMNTRLQVEHPVTELVMGIDLVEEMIRIAAGERLRFGQDDIRPNGWAVEARIYAEDPYRGFLPSVGRLTRYQPPAEGGNDGIAIRVDSGVAEGSEISLHYDPMIAKLCTHAPDRDAAIDAMADALDAFTLDGIRHNIPFLAALMVHPRWREGRLSTGFIEEAFPNGFHGVTPGTCEREVLAAIAAAAELAERRRLAPLAGIEAASSKPAEKEWMLLLGREQLAVGISPSADTALPPALTLSIDGRAPIAVQSDWRPGERIWRGRVGERAAIAQIERRGHALQVTRRGVSLSARVMTKRAAALAALMPEKSAADTSKLLLCPMPGLVVSIAVSEGQEVHAGETLAIVEAMKMENVLRAERSAIVARILASPGDSLAVDAVIMEFA